MPEQVAPLIYVKEHEVFLEDKASVERALDFARRFASGEPFKDRQEAGEAADAIKGLNNVRRDAEGRKLQITARWRASTNAVNVEYKELLAQIGAAEGALKQKGLAFKKAEEARAEEQRREEQRELDRQAEAAAQEAQEAAELAAQENTPEMRDLASEAREQAAAAAVATPPRPVALPKQVRGGFASLGSRTAWKFEVEDSAAVPAAYRVVDPRALKSVVDAEARMAKAENRDFKLEIPGVRIYPEEIAISR
jgi:hypothetical protein